MQTTTDPFSFSPLSETKTGGNKKIHIVLMPVAVEVDKIFRQLVPKKIHMLENQMKVVMCLIMNIY